MTQSGSDVSAGDAPVDLNEPALEPTRGRSFPIVGIGASAGGLEAFRQLLGALPIDTGMAFVLVQHLDPHHDSILAELLSETTQIQVSEVRADQLVEPNQVYVIPPSKGLVLADGMLRLVPRAAAGGAHMPIDSFFLTLAEEHASRAIGVILSGTGTDGTLGLEAIKHEGGITFAQDPKSARNDAMPKSAINSGNVDFVLTPEGIAQELIRLGAHSYLASEVVHGSEAVPVPSTPPTRGKRRAEDDGDEALARVLDLLRQGTGTDFGGYKKTTLRRRIARRMAVTHAATVGDYAHLLEGNATEVKALHDDCLICVTSFFRDPAVFEALSQQILPRLLEHRASDTPLRMWVPGCATGEEVYSIAMCLLERTAELSHNPSLQIFATDLSESALAKARDGSYPASIARDVSPERLRRFFAPAGDRYQISKAIRETCVFARHDLTRDPPYSRMDLISCRNLLIYLEPALQEAAFTTFHYALRPGGFLLVGPAETPGTSSALFSAVDQKHRIYSRQAASGPPRWLSVPRDARPLARASVGGRKAAGISEVPREVDRMLLARFGPAGVVVDENLRVLEFRGDTHPFLEHGHGKASLKLEHLARKGLLMGLRQAIKEARETNAPVQREALQVRYRMQLQRVRIDVIPIHGRAAPERCMLILFETETAEWMSPAASDAEDSGTGSAPAPGIDPKDSQIERLDLGLTQATEYMHTIVREHEAALEELQSSNEEALSSNEELQSLNEELQTAKEEIQSTNEELATLNQELQDRNNQLAHSNERIQRGLDSANDLVDTVPQPIVILDGQLRVEQANGAFYETFRTNPESTRTRALAELGSGQWNHPGLLAALQRLLDAGESIEALEVEVQLPELGQRTMSVTARRMHLAGNTPRVLIAIEDRTLINQFTQGRETLLALEHDARKKAEAADQLKEQFVATVSHELRGPLTVMAGWMNILLAAGATPDPSTMTRALAAMGRGVTAQERLISDLLDHSRIVTGKLDLQREAIDLLVVAEAALVGVRAAAEAKDIAVQLSGDPATSIVLGDFDRMQQVLWNLFLNAIKFTPCGGKVSISIGRIANQVHVEVSDTGRGIPAEFLPHVFERFRQAESSSNRTQPGLGLGLTLVRELVELHGGTVRANSAGTNQGTTFTVTLPIPALLLPASDSEHPRPMPDSDPPSRSRSITDLLALPTNMLHGIDVVVVDDEADARGALVALLENYGAEVRPAASVVEAIAVLEAGLPDVLISDLGMPGDDGCELIRRVRLLPACGALPSLAVSAYATDAYRLKVEQAGFQQHLEKPVAPAELLRTVASLAGRAASPVS